MLLFNFQILERASIQDMKFYVVKMPRNHFFACFYSRRPSFWSSASINEFTVLPLDGRGRGHPAYIKNFFLENTAIVHSYELRWTKTNPSLTKLDEHRHSYELKTISDELRQTKTNSYKPTMRILISMS